MTKFETFGIQAQQEATTKEEARRAFKWSCTCCCNRGMHLDCDRCAIAFVHNQTIACIDAAIADALANPKTPKENEAVTV